MNGLHERLEELEDTLQRWRKGERRAPAKALSILSALREDVEAVTRPGIELATLYEISREINSILDLDHLLEFIMDRALVLVQAERGFIVLWDAERDDFDIAVARRFSAGEVDDAQAELSHGLIRRVMASREPVVTTNAQEDPRFRGSQSIIAYQIRSVLAAPLESQDELVGAIYLDRRLSSRLFTQDDLRLLEGLAEQAAMALRIARLYDNLQAKNRELEAALADLQEAQDELIRAERLSVVGRMASSIIHDLKNPMTTIKGFADLLGRSDLTPEARQHFSQTVVRTIDAFVGMTQEVLDYARGGTPLDIKPANMGDFVQDICSFLKPEFTRHGLEIRTHLKYTGPVAMDRAKMWRVFINIANNAQDALDSGGIFMITSQLLDGEVEFWLADNGPGIPRAIRKTLFEPFVTHGKQYGTGLGLAIAKKIVEDHGGSIAAESRPGQGACFIIRIPHGEIPEEGPAPKAGAVPPQEPGSTGDPSPDKP